MTTTTGNNVEVVTTFGNKRWMGETLQTLRILVGIGPPLLLLFVILVIGFNALLPKYLPPTWIIELPLVLLVMNSLFGIICFVVALVALRAHIADVSVNLLLFGCGMFCLSLTFIVAGWFGAQAWANVNLTIHNTGVLLASVFTLLSSIALFSKGSTQKHRERERKNTGILAYLGVILLIAALSFAALGGYTPVFSVPGSGPTLVREVILTAATIFFGVSCLLIVIFDRYRRSFFLSCYAVALGMITISLIALITSQRANSALSWLGRSAQFAAGIYFLAAVVAAVRAAWTNRWTVPDTIRDFLRPSEALYRDLVETTTDAIIPISTSGEILLWDAAAEQMFGYNRMEAFKLTPSDLIDPENSKRMFQEVEAGTANGKGSCIGKLREVKARRKNGEEFPAELSFSSRRSGGGSVSTLVIRDITERKRAEEAVRRSEERYRDLIKYAPTGIYEVDFRIPRFTSVNDVMCQYLGFSKEELLHMNPSDIMDEENASLFRERIRRQLNGEKIDDSVEYRVRAKDGREYYANLNITFTYEDGKPKGAMVIAHDITERKQAEESLRENQALLSTIIESTPDPVYVKDKESRIVMANRALAKVVGKPIEEIVGKADSEYYGDLGTGQVLREHDLRVMKSGQNEVMEETVPTPEGYRTFLSSKTPYRNASGDIIGITGISRDITELKQIEEVQRKSEARFRLLSETAGRLLATDDPQQIVEDLCRDVMKYLDCHTFFNFLVDESAGRLRLNACAGIPDEEARKIQWLDYGNAVCGCVALERSPIIAEDIFHVPDPRTDLIKSYGIQAYCCHPLMVQGRLIGTLSFGTRNRPNFTPEEVDLMRTVTDEVAIAMQRIQTERSLRQHALELQALTETLEQRVKERTAELADLSSRLVSAQENERKRVSYDLHDNVWQTLLAIRFNIESLFSSHEDWEALARRSKEVTEDILGVVGKIRSMQGDLWPYVLDDIGIRATVDWYCREFEKEHSGLTIKSQVDLGEREIPSSARIVIYRVMQEALDNVAKHSQANRVSLSLVNKDHRVEFAIVDDGIGFDPEEILTKRAPWGGLGLLNIKARTELSGGTFRVESIKGKGTTIKAAWPL